MGLESGRSQLANSLGSNNSFNFNTSPNYGVVYEVITDVDTQTAKNKGLAGATAIGAIRFRMMGGSNLNYDEQLPIAFPIDKNVTSLPTKNEIVVIHNLGGNYHYSRVGGDLTPNVNTIGNVISSKFLAKEQSNDSTTKSKSYQNVSQTNISRVNSNSNLDEYDGFGEYFIPQQNIHKLKLYEGDTLIESRFGQSIRFSGYNNPNNSFSPTIIIRNGESGESLTSGIGNSTEEDINKDGNIILLGSNEYQLPFQPGTVDDNGSNDFETTPQSFKNYPNDLKGNQILLNSDRLIFSAKSSEMIFYSKGNYGFISDGELSIDNKFGIRANVNDDINITTNDRNMNINSGNGNINLGNQNLESLVRGETLVQLLTELITAIEVMTVATPAGPSSPPINVASFSKVKGQLRTMLSNLNKTS